MARLRTRAFQHKTFADMNHRERQREFMGAHSMPKATTTNTLPKFEWRVVPSSLSRARFDGGS